MKFIEVKGAPCPHANLPTLSPLNVVPRSVPISWKCMVLKRRLQEVDLEDTVPLDQAMFGDKSAELFVPKGWFTVRFWNDDRVISTQRLLLGSTNEITLPTN